MERARDAGRRLAERHLANPASAEPAGSLVNYAELRRADDWTLRSALVRLAQSQPELVAALMIRVRRLDTALAAVARPLQQHTVVCDRSITIDDVERDPIDAYPDSRVADLVRVAASADEDGHAVVEAYLTTADLTEPERAALPLLEIALAFDRLAEELVAWARIAPAPAPVESVRATIRTTQQRLDELGVPVEQPRSGRRTRRSG